MKRISAVQAAVSSVALAALIGACGDSTSSDGGGGGGTLPADVSIVVGAQTKGFGAYSPDTITVQMNGGASVRVRWRNDDDVGGVNVPHTVTDTTAANAFNVTIQPGDTASVNFTTAGSYPYKCGFHSGMRGLVIVQP